jgi:hypothetical protein
LSAGQDSAQVDLTQSIFLTNGDGIRQNKSVGACHVELAADLGHEEAPHCCAISETGTDIGDDRRVFSEYFCSNRWLNAKRATNFLATARARLAVTGVISDE